MAKAIISPSVLASDLSNLTAECKRMISEGADWLHMGMSSVGSVVRVGADGSSRCHGRVGRRHSVPALTLN